MSNSAKLSIPSAPLPDIGHHRLRKNPGGHERFRACLGMFYQSRLSIRHETHEIAETHPFFDHIEMNKHIGNHMVYIAVGIG